MLKSLLSIVLLKQRWGAGGGGTGFPFENKRGPPLVFHFYKNMKYNVKKTKVMKI